MVGKNGDGVGSQRGAEADEKDPSHGVVTEYDTTPPVVTVPEESGKRNIPSSSAVKNWLWEFEDHGVNLLPSGEVDTVRVVPSSEIRRKRIPAVMFVLEKNPFEVFAAKEVGLFQEANSNPCVPVACGQNPKVIIFPGAVESRRQIPARAFVLPNAGRIKAVRV
jgi:hypothetical protein